MSTTGTSTDTSTDPSTDSAGASGRSRGRRKAVDRTEAGRISIRDLRKTFVRTDGAVVTAIDDVSIDIEPGQFTVLLGPSGCGKTTLLRCIAGLESPESGVIEVSGRAVFSAGVEGGSRGDRVSLTPQQRELGMVFQSYALWPHMTVARNVAFPMTTRRHRRAVSKGEVKQRVARALEVVGIGELADQPISALSGGQQQRVALARAIAFGSDVILFDEPLSNVDAKVRVQLRTEIHALQRELGFTAVYVTHDQEEAMALADVLVVLRNGQVEQYGEPRALYRAPASRYVADFVGTADLLDGKVVAADSEVLVHTEIGTIAVPRNADHVAGEVGVGDDVAVVVRAEDWRVGPGVDDQTTYSAVVEAAAYLGSSTQYRVRVGTRRLRVRPQGSRAYDEGQVLTLSLDPADLHVVTR